MSARMQQVLDASCKQQTSFQPPPFRHSFRLLPLACRLSTAFHPLFLLTAASHRLPHAAASHTAACRLQAEYGKLQALYEDLKAAKIDEEVQQLLEQQNRHVTEHGHKAAQLVEHYKGEVGAAAPAVHVW